MDIRPLRRFAPPPLQGGGVYFATPSIEYQDFQPEKSFPYSCTKQCLPHVSPYAPKDSGIRPSVAQDYKIHRSKESAFFWPGYSF